MPHRDAWGARGRFIKLKYMEHACTALSEAEMAAHAHLSNQHMGPTWGARPPMGLGYISGEGDVRSYQGTSEVQGEARHTMWQR